MENFGWTKNLKNILGELNSNVGIFKGSIYLLNAFFFCPHRIFQSIKLLDFCKVI